MIARLLREYLVRFPIARGKGFMLRHVAPRLPERAREFDVPIGSVTVVARWDEVTGRHILRAGSFEAAELSAALAIVASGDTVIDVGANIGLLTCPLASAVGHDGLVVAVEPVPDNVRRLRANLLHNGLTNARLIEAAAARADGFGVLQIARDPAFGSLKPIVKYATMTEIEVALRSLDSVWNELGRPAVALVKIDVEGAELDVIDGAMTLLDRLRPALLVESEPGAQAERVRDRLAALGYEEVTPPDFSRDNHLYLRRSPTSPL